MSYPPPTCAQASDAFDFSSFGSGGIALPVSSEHEPLAELSNLALPDSSKPSKGSTVPTPSSASISKPPPTLLPSPPRTQPAGPSATAPTLLTTHATVSTPSTASHSEPPTIAGSFATQGPAGAFSAASTTPLVATAAGAAKKNAPRKANGTRGQAPLPQATAPTPASAASGSAPSASRKRRREDDGVEWQKRIPFRTTNPDVAPGLAVFRGPPQPVQTPTAPLPTPTAPLPTPAAPLPPCYQALMMMPPMLPPRNHQASQTMTTHRPTGNQQAPPALPVATTAPPAMPAQVHVPHSRRLLSYKGDFSVPSDAPPVPETGCTIWIPGPMLVGPRNIPMTEENKKRYYFCSRVLQGDELKQTRRSEGSKFWGNEVFDPETKERFVIRISVRCAFRRNPDVPLPPPTAKSQQSAATYAPADAGNAVQSAYMPPATTQYSGAAASYAPADGNAAMFTPSFYVPPPPAQYSAATYPPANGPAPQSAYMPLPTAQYSAAASTSYAPADGGHVPEFMNPLFMGLSGPPYQGYASTSAMTLDNYNPASAEVGANPPAFTQMSPLFMASSVPPSQGYASTSTMPPADYNPAAELAASYAQMADTTMGYPASSSSQFPVDTAAVVYPGAGNDDFKFDFTFDASQYLNLDYNFA
ncbi:hypothetical protein DFH06DRAFT_1313883 [Mycena polygramma]|nr:hypothetical protein DFH06DRAFT_1313883 [Mycena polygramma]